MVHTAYECTFHHSKILSQDPADTVEACRGPMGRITRYQISFQTASSMVTESVNIAMCTAGRCSHTFEPPSSYDSVSVAAVNVVGVGAARTCTTQTISELNIIIVTTNLHTYRLKGNGSAIAKNNTFSWLCKFISC